MKRGAGGGGGGNKHLQPLLEFIEYVARDGQRGNMRFPRRCNGLRTGGGAATRKRRADTAAAPHAATSASSPDHTDVTVAPPSAVPHDPVTSPPPPARVPAKRKRASSRRGDSGSNDDGATSGACELAVKHDEGMRAVRKGVYTTQYVDVSLPECGAAPLLAGAAASGGAGALLTPAAERRAYRALIGVPCCYLPAGSSQVVIGRVVDTDVRDGRVQVVPDSTDDACDLVWVDVARACSVPDDMSALQDAVHRHIASLLASSQRDADADDK